MLGLVFLLGFFACTHANATCSKPEGPCTNGTCAQPGYVCADGVSCCNVNNLGGATTTASPATTKAPSSNCVDKLNPSTGVSDCPKNAYLCNDSTYYSLMTEQCPKTCGRCGGNGGVTTKPSGSCVDKTNPSTGVSDCPKNANLCNNATYKSLMAEQCPKTCGLC